MNIQQEIMPTLAELLEYEVHPVAAAARMLPDDELEALAESIKAKGLDNPIIITRNKTLIDGRNRLAACDKAGIQPTVKYIDADDNEIRDFILRQNNYRRHESKSARTMRVAVAYPEPAKAHRGKKGSATETFPEIHAGQLSMARALVNADPAVPDLIHDVFYNDKSIDQAHRELKIRKGQIDQKMERMAALMSSRPDLADQVHMEMLSLEDAEAKAKSDEADRRNAVYATTSIFVDGMKAFNRPLQWIEEYSGLIDPKQFEKAGVEIDAAALRHAAEFANALADQIENSTQNDDGENDADA